MVETSVIRIGDHNGKLPDGATTGLISGIGELVRLGIKITGEKVTITNEKDNTSWTGEKRLVIRDIERFCKSSGVSKEDLIKDLNAFKDALRNKSKSRFNLDNVIKLLRRKGVSLDQISGFTKYLNSDEAIDALLISLDENPDDYKKTVEVKAKPESTPKLDTGKTAKINAESLIPKGHAIYRTKLGTIYAWIDADKDGEIDLKSSKEKGSVLCIIKGKDGKFERFLLNEANVSLTAGNMICGNPNNNGVIGKEQLERRDEVIAAYAKRITGSSVETAVMAYRYANSFTNADFDKLAEAKESVKAKIAGVLDQNDPRQYLVSKGCSELLAGQIAYFISYNKQNGISEEAIAGYIMRLALNSGVPSKMGGTQAVPTEHRFDISNVSRDSLWNWMRQDRLEFEVKSLMDRMQNFGRNDKPDLSRSERDERNGKLGEFMGMLKRPETETSEETAESEYTELINEYNDGCILGEALFSSDEQRPGLYEFYIKKGSYDKAYALLSRLSGVGGEDKAAKLINACLTATKDIQLARSICRGSLKLIDKNYIISQEAQSIWGAETAQEFIDRVGRELRVHDDVIIAKSQVLSYSRVKNERTNKWGWHEIADVSLDTVNTAIGELEAIAGSSDPKYTAETKAYARMALGECYIAKARKIPAESGEKVIKLRDPRRNKEISVKLLSSERDAVAALLTAARHFRAAYREYKNLLASETESGYYKKQVVEAVTKIGKLVQEFHPLGLSKKNHGSGLKRYQYVTVALAAEIPEGSQLVDHKDQHRRETPIKSLEFKSTYTTFSRFKSGTPMGLVMENDQENPFIDPLEQEAAPPSDVKVKHIVRRARQRTNVAAATTTKKVASQKPHIGDGDAFRDLLEIK